MNSCCVKPRWPLLGSLTMVYKIWTIGSTLERIGERIREQGAADDGDVRMVGDGSLSQVTTRLSAGRQAHEIH